MTIALALRGAGLSLILLALFHAVLWRTLEWGQAINALDALTARVFAVHTFFIAFVLGALGALSLWWPQLLLAPSPLARLLLIGIVTFWVARLIIQPLVFDRAMRSGWTRSLVLRVFVNAIWFYYIVVYGAVLHGQFAESQP